jgi:hypothetical protein
VNRNLCAGLLAGIEGAVHAVQQLLDGGGARVQQPPQDAAAPAAMDGVNKEILHPAVADPTAAIDPEGLLLVDAWNGHALDLLASMV